MLTDLCQELRNWFEVEKHFGTFVIENGALTAPFLKAGQYFRIDGSTMNQDGVWLYGEDELDDETFDGVITVMSIPKAVLALDEEIDAWVEKYGEAQNSPYSSESFGGYSYSKAVPTGGTGGGATWQSIFHSRLNKWRKL